MTTCSCCLGPRVEFNSFAAGITSKFIHCAPTARTLIGGGARDPSMCAQYILTNMSILYGNLRRSKGCTCEAGQTSFGPSILATHQSNSGDIASFVYRSTQSSRSTPKLRSSQTPSLAEWYPTAPTLSKETVTRAWASGSSGSKRRRPKSTQWPN